MEWDKWWKMMIMISVEMLPGFVITIMSTNVRCKLTWSGGWCERRESWQVRLESVRNTKTTGLGPLQRRQSDQCLDKLENRSILNEGKEARSRQGEGNARSASKWKEIRTQIEAEDEEKRGQAWAPSKYYTVRRTPRNLGLHNTEKTTL